MFSFLGFNKNKKCVEKLANSKNVEEQKKYKNICKIIDNIQISEDINVVNQNFTEFVHLWFNDNAVLNEIYKHLASRGLCVLHEIVIWHNIGDSQKTAFVIPHYYGYDNMPGSTKKHYTSYLDYDLYYNTQIKQCNSDIMAIPITIYNNNDTISHSNMIVIKRVHNQQIKLSVEIFEPYGLMSRIDNSREFLHLMQFLFSNEIDAINDIQMINVARNCIPQTIIIQKSNFKNSCAIFSIWYAVKRLLNPDNDPYETAIQIERYIRSTSDHVNAIKNVILSFMNLIDINEKGIINDKKMIDTNLLKSIIGGYKKSKKSIAKHKKTLKKKKY